MNRKNLIILITYFFLVSIHLNAHEVKFFLEKIRFLNEPFGEQTVILPDDGNILKYSIFNLFDSNLKTAAALKQAFFDENFFKNVYSIKKPKSWIQVRLQEKISIDEIYIYNGYQKRDDLFYKNSRVKNIKFFIKNFYRQKGINKYLQKSYLLSDKQSPNVISFKEDINTDFINIAILSTYPGTKYEDICISEIEFYYKGEKYEITNLKEAKEEYLKQRRRKFYFSDRKKRPSLMVVEKMSDRFKNALRKMGYNPEKIEVLATWENKNNRRRGNFYNYKLEIIKKSEKFVRTKTDHWTEYHLPAGDKIGEWKKDKYGNIWVRVDEEKWELTRPRRSKRKIKRRESDGMRVITFFQGTVFEFRGYSYLYD